MKKRIYQFLYQHTKGKLQEKFARSYRKYCWKPQINGNNNDLKIFLNGEIVNIDDLGGLPNANIRIDGNNNKISIHADDFIANRASLNLYIEANHNEFILEQQVRGGWNISMYGDKNYFSVGRETACGDFSAALHSSKVIIGHHCMISSSEELWTDGHSVIDNETKRCLNVPQTPTVIGNHVWPGRRVTLTK